MFLTICLNPVIQKTIILDKLASNQVNRSNEYHLDIAGKGINVSRVLAEMNATVRHITQIGGNFKKYFLKQIKKLGITITAIDSQAEIRFCYTLIERKTGHITEIVEQGNAVTYNIEKAVLQAFKKHLPRCQMLIISGSKAPGFSDQIFPHMVKRAKALNKLTVLDFRGSDLLNSIQYTPHVIKPNFSEFINTFLPEWNAQNRDNSLIKKVKEKIIELYKKHNITTILTDGPNPIIYNQGSSIYTYTPQKITPHNTTGCGDTFTAAFALEYLNSRKVAQAVIQGEKWARYSALQIRPGTRIELL